MATKAEVEAMEKELEELRKTGDAAAIKALEAKIRASKRTQTFLDECAG